MAEAQETQEQCPANRHDPCLRADRGALPQRHWPSRQLLLRCPTWCIPAVVGNCSCVVLHMDVRMPRAHDALVRPLDNLARDQPHCTLAGGGHFLQEDVGEALAGVLIDFIGTT